MRAVLATNGLCENLASFTPLLPVTVSGLLYCEDGYLLITLPSQFERDAVVQRIVENPCVTSRYIAVGDTWVVLPSPPTELRASRVAGIIEGEVRALPCERE
jgi:hypothetical protein